MYLLDTNICSNYLDEHNTQTKANISLNFENCDIEDIFLCSIVKAELFHGAYKSPNRVEYNLNLYRHFFSHFSPSASLPFNDICAEIFAQIRADLENTGKPVGINDIMIASIAIANELTVVTNNIKHFKQIMDFSRFKNLQFINWTESPK